jgi:hypothetical protein
LLYSTYVRHQSLKTLQPKFYIYLFFV